MANHHEVAHAWAHQTGKQRNGKRVFYEGPTIYSHGHHFAIARLIDVKGVPSVLFTTQDYSVSTGQHKNIVSGACRHLQRFYVRNPRDSVRLSDWEETLTSAGAEVASAGRRRSESRREYDLSRAQMYLDRANALNIGFDLGQTVVTLETLGVIIADREARLAKARKLEEKRQAKLRKERFKIETEARSAWLAGYASSHWRGTAPDGSALLRVIGDELETSQGAKVPLDHAIKAFWFVKLCRDNKTAWARNGYTLHVGNFQIDQIDAQGNFRAGCHLIAWTEVARLATELGLINETPSSEGLTASAAH